MDLVQAILQRERRARSRAWDTGVAQGPAVGDWVPVNCSGAVEQVWCSSAITPAAGDVVAVVRGHTPMVVGILASGTPGSTDLGPLPPVVGDDSGVTRIRAQYSWTWEFDDASDPTLKRFRWMAGVYQGDDWTSPLVQRRGWWFYQWAVSAMLAGVTVDSARIRLPRLITDPSVTTITLTFSDAKSVWPPQIGDTGIYGDVPAQPGQTDQAPTDATATIGAGGVTWVDLGASVGQRMVDAEPPSVLPLAVGLAGAGNVGMAGVDTDPQSGLLEIAWHR